MFDMPDTERPESTGDAASGVENSTLDLDQFTPEELARLEATRERLTAQALDEPTPEYKRLLFARWLYEHGHIGG
jgi:hypothetical protein